MKKFLQLLVVASLAMFALTGCSEKVPPGHKGKILGPEGYQPEIYEPSKVWVGPRESLVLIETTTQTWKEKMSVIMADKLKLGVEVRFRMRIDGSDKVINGIFNDIKMNDNLVTVEEVYQVYGQMLVRDLSRTVLSKYTVQDVHKNRAAISAEIYNTVKKATDGIPLVLSDVGLGDLQYPDMVTKAIEKAKQREMEIEEAKANALKQLEKKRGEEELAKADYRIKMLEAKRIRDYNKMTAEGITKSLLELRKLELQEKQIEVQSKFVESMAGNQNAVFIPLEMMTNPNYQIGQYMNMMTKGK